MADEERINRSRPVRFIVVRPDSATEKVLIDDDDFGYDAMLTVHGDFSTVQEKLRYAEAVARALNAAEFTIPVTAAPYDKEVT